jgi:hypothetical protein
MGLLSSCLGIASCYGSQAFSLSGVSWSGVSCRCMFIFHFVVSLDLSKSDIVK